MNQEHHEKQNNESLFSLQLPDFGRKGYLLLGIGLLPFIALQVVQDYWHPQNISEKTRLETIFHVIIFIEVLFAFPGCFLGFAYASKNRGNRIVCLVIGVILLLIAMLGTGVAMSYLQSPQ